MKAKITNIYAKDRTYLYTKVPLDTPYSVNIEPTTYCNIKCKYCIQSLPQDELAANSFSYGYMSDETFELCLEQLAQFPNRIKSVTFGGLGEPTLHKKLPEMINRVRDKNITSRINLITNAIRINRSLALELIGAGLTNMKISLQGLTADKCKEICGVAIDTTKLKENLEFLYHHKKDCIIGVKIPDIALSHADEKVFYDHYGNICDLIGIEHIVPCFQEVDYSSVAHLSGHTSRYGLAEKKITVCPQLFYRLNIMQNGDVTLCTMRGLAADGMNIHKMCLTDIWNSEARTDMLKKNLLRNNTGALELCKNCNVKYDFSYQEDNLDPYAHEIYMKICANHGEVNEK